MGDPLEHYGGMDERLRDSLWSLLRECFAGIQRELAGIKVTMDHYHTEHFWMRAYMQCQRDDDRVVVISVDIKRQGDGIDVWGDISLEGGTILRDLLKKLVPVDADQVRSCVEEIAHRASMEVDCIREALDG